MSQSIVGFIFARGGSKGLPRKNIRKLNGKPLIAYAIETGKASKWIDSVIVSTDDQEIAAVARQYGAEVYIRPDDLAQDDSPERKAWQHAIHMWQKENDSLLDVFVSIPATSPLRIVDDLDCCVEQLLDNDADIVITVCEAARSPYYNMVVLDDDNNAQLVIPPTSSFHHRQEVPPVYDMTTVAYAARSRYVLSTDSIFEGRVQAVVVPLTRSLDIDTKLDFDLAEILMDSQRSV